MEPDLIFRLPKCASQMPSAARSAIPAYRPIRKGVHGSSVIVVRAFAAAIIGLTGSADFGMKRAHFPVLTLMLNLSSFFILLCGLGGSVWWACRDDKNET